MIVKKLFLAAALLCVGFAGSGCITQSATTDKAWGQYAEATGALIGKTKADEKIAAASVQVSKYCGTLQAVAVGATIFSPEKVRSAALKAEAVVNTVCASPPTDVASALRVLADAYVSARNAGAVPATAPPAPAGAAAAPTI